jgi:hypothetical protein
VTSLGRIVGRLLGADVEEDGATANHPRPPARLAPAGTHPVTHGENALASPAPLPKTFAAFNATLPTQPDPPDTQPRFRRDESYENSPGVAEALAAVDGGAPLVLVSGRAGTGKTTLIRYLRRRPGGETQAVVAPTAVAALNSQAQTIHSFFRLPHLVLDARHLPDGGRFGMLYRRMTRLVIDEISMVRADLVDAMDARLRDIRKDARPFGGVQVVMVGDFLQLPPVVEEDRRPLLHGLGYRSPFAFSAHVLQQGAVSGVTLDHVYRQEEQDFVDLLSRLRLGEDADEVAEVLNARCCGPHRADAQPLLLTPTRAAADRYNRDGLAALPGPSAVLRAEISGKLEVGRDQLPVPETLELRVGARVMAAKNDPQKRWINGSLGTVTRLAGAEVLVRFDRGAGEHLVAPAVWEKVRQVWNAGTGRIDNEVVGAYRQVPLIPAWALTIHKAQGLTLDDVRVDLGGGAFAAGQVYVALSRVRTMAGLSFARPLRVGDLHADPMLVAFTEFLQDGSAAPASHDAWQV